MNPLGSTYQRTFNRSCSSVNRPRTSLISVVRLCFSWAPSTSIKHSLLVRSSTRATKLFAPEMEASESYRRVRRWILESSTRVSATLNLHDTVLDTGRMTMKYTWPENKDKDQLQYGKWLAQVRQASHCIEFHLTWYFIRHQGEPLLFCLCLWVELDQCCQTIIS